MSDTEKLLAEIEAALHANGCDCDCGCDSDGHGDSCVLCWPCRCDQLVKIVREARMEADNHERVRMQLVACEQAALSPSSTLTIHPDYKSPAYAAIMALQKQLEELRDENYGDLLEQMDEAWGPSFNNVRGEEVRAFLDSRRTHKPTRSLRKQLEEIKSRTEYAEAYLQDATTSGGAVRAEYVELQKQLAEMRGDLVELLEKLYVPMSGDGYREHLEVKS